MQNKDVSEWFDDSAFKSERSFRINRVSLRAVTCRRRDDGDSPQGQKCFVQRGEARCVEAVVVCNQEIHGETTVTERTRRVDTLPLA